MSPTLEDINLTVKKGELVAILGRVGAGKVGLIGMLFLCRPLIVLSCPVESHVGDCRRDGSQRRERSAVGLCIVCTANTMVSHSVVERELPSLACWHRIMSATVRDNIIFSHEFDEPFYNLVLDGVHAISFPFVLCADKLT